MAYESGCEEPGNKIVTYGEQAADTASGYDAAVVLPDHKPPEYEFGDPSVVLGNDTGAGNNILDAENVTRQQTGPDLVTGTELPSALSVADGPIDSERLPDNFTAPAHVRHPDNSIPDSAVSGDVSGEKMPKYGLLDSSGAENDAEQLDNIPSMYADLIDRAIVHIATIQITEDGSFTEDVALLRAGEAADCLCDIESSIRQIVDEWHEAAADFDPDNNVAGFLDWDGINWPEPMEQLRNMRKLLNQQGRELANAILHLTAHNYVTHQSQDDGPHTAIQTESLINNVTTAYDSGFDLPIGNEHYRHLFVSTLRLVPAELTYKNDSISKRMKLLQGQRRKFDPEYIAAQKPLLERLSEDVRNNLVYLWEGENGIFNCGELDKGWESVRTKLLMAQQLTHKAASGTVIDDAVHLLVRSEQLDEDEMHNSDEWRRWTAQNGPTAKQEYIREILTAELFQLTNARLNIEQAQTYEGFSSSIIDNLKSLRPRLRDAIDFLISNAALVNRYTRAAAKSTPFREATFVTFWQEIIAEPELPPSNNSTHEQDD